MCNREEKTKKVPSQIAAIRLLPRFTPSKFPKFERVSALHIYLYEAAAGTYGAEGLSFFSVTRQPSVWVIEAKDSFQYPRHNSALHTPKAFNRQTSCEMAWIRVAAHRVLSKNSPCCPRRCEAEAVGSQ